MRFGFGGVQPTDWLMSTEQQAATNGRVSDDYHANFQDRGARPNFQDRPVPLFAARTLKCHRPIPGHAIAAVRELKSSLWATAGGKGGA